MKIPGIPNQPTAAQIREMQRVYEDRLKEEAKGAAKFEYANADPSGSGDFILLGTTSVLSLTKTAIRMNQAQALALSGQICQMMALYLMRGSAPPPPTKLD